jgi:hypothetical protein
VCLLGLGETASWRVECRVPFVQVPGQPVDDAGAFGDQVVAVVHEQAHVPARIVVRGGQVGFPQCRSGWRAAMPGVDEDGRES